MSFVIHRGVLWQKNARLGRSPHLRNASLGVRVATICVAIACLSTSRKTPKLSAFLQGVHRSIVASRYQ